MTHDDVSLQYCTSNSHKSNRFPEIRNFSTAANRCESLEIAKHLRSNRHTESSNKLTSIDSVSSDAAPVEVSALNKCASETSGGASGVGTKHLERKCEVEGANEYIL